MSWTNFSIAKLCYTEIKHSDWTYQVMWLLFTNQKALFQNTEAMTISNLFIIGQWLWISLQRGYFRYHKFEVWIQSSTVNIWKDENKEKRDREWAILKHCLWHRVLFMLNTSFLVVIVWDPFLVKKSFDSSNFEWKKSKVWKMRSG